MNLLNLSYSGLDYLLSAFCPKTFKNSWNIYEITLCYVTDSHVYQNSLSINTFQAWTFHIRKFKVFSSVEVLSNRQRNLKKAFQKYVISVMPRALILGPWMFEGTVMWWENTEIRSEGFPVKREVQEADTVDFHIFGDCMVEDKARCSHYKKYLLYWFQELCFLDV